MAWKGWRRGTVSQCLGVAPHTGLKLSAKGRFACIDRVAAWRDAVAQCSDNSRTKVNEAHSAVPEHEEVPGMDVRVE